MSFDEIDKGDWRLQTTSHLATDWENPWTGKTVPKGTRLTVVSVMQLTKKKQLTVPIPNASAVMLNSAARAFENAKKLRESSKIDTSIKKELSFHTETDALNYIERMIEAIVLAYSAIEAFANECIPSDFIYARHKNSDVILEASNKASIERFVTTEEKLTTVLPEILNCRSPKGTHCWQNYKLLKNSRDRIIHMKTQDRNSSGPEIETVWKAIILTPAPHLVSKTLIDYYVQHMENKPGWHSRFLDAK